MGLFDWLFRPDKPTPGPRTGPDGGSAPPRTPASVPSPPPSTPADPASEPPSVEDAPPEWASFFGSAARFEKFDHAVRACLRARGRRALIAEDALRVVPAPGATEPSPDHARGEFGLTNLAQLCARSPDDRWDEIITTHFNNLEAIDRGDGLPDLSTFQNAAPLLGVRLWPAELDEVRRLSVWREDLPGLLTSLCADSPTSILTVSRQALEKWGVTEQEAFDRALANLDTLAPVRTHTVEMLPGQTLHEIAGESFFSCAWALRLADRPELAGPYGAFFSVPTRHRVIVMPFVGIVSLQALAALMQAVTAMSRDGPGTVSARLYWLRPDDAGILEVPYSIEGGAMNVTPPDELVEVMNELPDEPDQGS